MLFHYAPFELEEREWRRRRMKTSYISWFLDCLIWSSNSEKISQINMVQGKTKNTTICFNRLKRIGTLLWLVS